MRAHSARSATSPTATSRRCGRRSPPRTALGDPGADPGRERRRRPARRLPARRPRDHPGHRHAAGPGRDPDRHRPHRALVRAPGPGGRRPGRGHPGQGTRRRPADRRHPRLRRRRRAAAPRPARAGTFSGRNPVVCAAALAVLHTIGPEGLAGPGDSRSATDCAPGSRPSAIRWWTTSRGAGTCSGSVTTGAELAGCSSRPPPSGWLGFGERRLHPDRLVRLALLLVP